MGVFDTIIWKWMRNPFSSSLISELSCGLCGWRPQWLQRFKSMKIFMLCYIGLGVFHGMYSVYLSSVVPSIERRFGFTSQQIGQFRAMADVSRIISSLFVAHYGGAGNRPKWIGGGAILLSLGMIVMASPEIFFPVTKTSIVYHVVASAADSNEKFCHSNHSRISVPRNCTGQEVQSNFPPLVVFGFSEFIMGLGATTIMILALPFIDDNVTCRNSPIYFALSFAGRLFGPLVGFGLGAIITTVFFDFTTPNFSSTDPRWIAAWYLGLLICASGIFVFGLLIMCFPSTVQEVDLNSKDCIEIQAKRRESIMRKATKLRDFPINLKRIFVNLPFMIKLLSQLLEALVISGYLSFVQKFIKEQYRVSMAVASAATGIPGVFSAFIGIFIGSAIIKKWNLQPRHVSLLTAASAVIGSASYFIVIAFGCDKLEISGIDDVVNPYNISNNGDYCFNKLSCDCDSTNFNPVCDVTTMRGYVSACVAGCQSAVRKNGTKIYSGCTCADNFSSLANMGSNLGMFNQSRKVKIIPGLCQEQCWNFAPYVVVMCLAKVFLGIPIAGIVMMQFRMVDPDLKSLANGMTSVVMSLFGFLPAPIIAGAIIDTACRYWQQTPCGGKGSCLLYNAQDFRWKLHITVAIFKLVTCGLDLVIAWLVWDWKFDRSAPSGPLVPCETKEDQIHGSLSTSTVTLTSDVSEKPVPSSEEEDKVTDLPVMHLTHRRPTMSHRRQSLADVMTDVMNTKALTEEHDDTEFISQIAASARRGSLLE